MSSSQRPLYYQRKRSDRREAQGAGGSNIQDPVSEIWRHAGITASFLSFTKERLERLFFIQHRLMQNMEKPTRWEVSAGLQTTEACYRLYRYAGVFIVISEVLVFSLCIFFPSSFIKSNNQFTCRGSTCSPCLLCLISAGK